MVCNKTIIKKKVKLNDLHFWYINEFVNVFETGSYTQHDIIDFNLKQTRLSVSY